MRHIVKLSVMFFFGLMFVNMAVGQATVTGRVYQADRSLLPGAIVVLKNPSINLLRTAVTNDDGEYMFRSVQPAPDYEVEAKLNGQTIAQRVGITVQVGDANVVFPALIQNVIETVKKAADNPKIEINLSPSDSENISAEQLRSLPLFDRTFLALGLLTPSTHNVPAGSPLAGATFSISGARPTSNNFLLDGTDNVASSSNQAIPFQVNDSIQEFRVIYANAPAEYGRGQGGVVDVVTSRARISAGSKWHGSAFGFFANDALNSDSPLSAYSNSTFEQALLRANSSSFSGVSNQPAIVTAPRSYNSLVGLLPGSGCLACGKQFNALSLLSSNDNHTQPLNQKQFGFNIGGPMTSKILLFGSYEGTLIDNPNQVFERVPTDFDRSYADVPSLASNPNSQFAQGILSLYPRANVIGVPGVLEFFKGQAPNFTHVHNLLFRTDYAPNEHTTYLLRYNGQILDQLHDDNLPVTSFYAGNGADRKAQNQSLTLSQVHNSPSGWLNDARLSFTHFRLDERPQDSGLNAISLGLPSSALPTFVLSGIDTRTTGAIPGTPGKMGGWFDSFWNKSGCTNCSSISPSLDGLFPFARIGAPLTAPSQRRDAQLLASDSFALTWHRHQIKFGGEFRYLQNIVSDGGMARGLVVSNNIGEFTHDSETCISCGTAFLNPSFDYAIRQPDRYVGDLRSWTAAGFIEDRFNMRRNLTLSLGLRYEFFSQPREQNNLLWNFDPAANGLVQQGGTQVIDPFGYPCGSHPKLDSVYAAAKVPSPWNCGISGTGLPGSNLANFAPRIGFAYSPVEGKTVIRGGAGLFYDQLPVSTTAQLLLNRPSPFNVANPSAIYGQNFFSSRCINTFNNTPAQCGLGNISLNPAKANPSDFANFQAASGPPAIYAVDRQHADTPYSIQFNLSIQQQLGKHFAAQAGYIGAIGYNQPVLYNSNFQDEFFCTSSANNSGAKCDNISYFPIFTLSNLGSSNYHSLVLKLQGQSWHGLRFNAGYTFSRSLDNASSGQFPQVASTLWNQLFGLQLYGVGSPFAFILGSNGLVINGISLSSLQGAQLQFTVPGNQAINSALVTTGARPIITSPYLIPQNPLNFLRDDYGRSDFDTPHRAVIDFTYDLPFARKSRWLGGWEISSIIVAESGQPFTVFAGPAFGEITQRANLNGQAGLSADPNAYINGAFSLVGTDQNACPNVYANPSASGAQLYGGKPGFPGPCVGNTGRNQFYGPIYSSTDLAVQKRFLLFGENKRLTIRAEFFNLFNYSNFYNPVSALSTDGFTFNPQFGHVVSAHDARQIQLGARFDF